MEVEEKTEEVQNSLTKLELNNQIVGMRHNVNRAKVQTLNKLTHKIKALRNKKGPDNIKEKHLKKADRFLQEFLVMKKIPPDEVAAFALSNSKKVDDILKDVESSWRLKALARLSIHKSLVPVVESFRSKYPDWKKDFPKVLIALKKRKKLKLDGDKKVKNKSVKLNDAVAMKSDSMMLKNKNNEENKEPGNKRYEKIKSGIKNIESDDNNMVSSDEEIESGDDNMDFNNKFLESDNNNSSSEEEMDYEESFIQTRGNRFSVSSDDTNLSDKLNKNYKKSSESVEMNENRFTELPDDPVKSEPPTSESNQKNVDPFFIGVNDEEYETLNPISEMTEKDESILFRKPEFDDSDFDKYRHREKYKREKIKFLNNGFNNSNNRNNFSTNRNNFSNKKSNYSNKDYFHTNNKQSFSNKKDNFSDNHRFNKTTEYGGKTKTKTNFEENKKTNEKLHPSWEAKKKLNTVTAEFAGKKIVFD